MRNSNLNFPPSYKSCRLFVRPECGASLCERTKESSRDVPNTYLKSKSVNNYRLGHAVRIAREDIKNILFSSASRPLELKVHINYRPSRSVPAMAYKNKDEFLEELKLVLEKVRDATKHSSQLGSDCEEFLHKFFECTVESTD